MTFIKRDTRSLDPKPDTLYYVYIEVIKGDTRSLDYGSCDEVYAAWFLLELLMRIRVDGKAAGYQFVYILTNQFADNMNFERFSGQKKLTGPRTQL